MKKSELNALLKSYARHLVGTVLTAIIVVGHNRVPVDFTAQDWLEVANAVWVSLVPVIIKWADPSSTSFGRK